MLVLPWFCGHHSEGVLCDNEFLPAELLPLQNELCEWWEAGPNVSADQRRNQIQELLSKGYYRTVSLLPTLPPAKLTADGGKKKMVPSSKGGPVRAK